MTQRLFLQELKLRELKDWQEWLSFNRTSLCKQRQWKILASKPQMESREKLPTSWVLLPILAALFIMIIILQHFFGKRALRFCVQFFLNAFEKRQRQQVQGCFQPHLALLLRSTQFWLQVIGALVPVSPVEWNWLSADRSADTYLNLGPLELEGKWG